MPWPAWSGSMAGNLSSWRERPRRWCRRRRGVYAVAVFAGFAMFAAPPARADDFYAGKTIELLIGFSSGGGYDLYGRTLARYLGRHIPGLPQVLPQNMPGAGSLKSANYLYN